MSVPSDAAPFAGVIRERAVARIRRRIGSSHKMGVPEMFPTLDAVQKEQFKL